MNRESTIEDMPPLVDFLLNPEKYPAVEVKPKPKKRGRPHRFRYCPVCGEEGLRVYKTEQAGHCRNIYCDCPACGIKMRFVTAGEGGYWVRVRTLDESDIKPL